jgi:iron(III) transport system substrate-binding protein
MRFIACALAAACSFAWLSPHAAGAQEAPSKVEQIYADLAKLPPKQRHEKIVEGARAEGSLNFIHSLRNGTGPAQTAVFKKQYPFLNVERTELGSQDAAQRLVTEETAGRHLTDITIVEVADMTEILAKDMAARYPTPATKQIYKQYRPFLDPQDRWIPFATNEHGIAYNTNLVKQPPKKYEELCDARYKGTTSFDPLEVRFLVGMYKIFKDDLNRVDDWLRCVGANKPIIQRGHTQRHQLMVAGDHAISPDQYFSGGLADKKKNPALPFGADFDAPVALSPVTAVINRNTPHPYAAALLADWLVGPESQAVLVHEFRGPVAAKHPFIPENAEIVPFTSVSRDIEDKLVDMWKARMPK